MAGAEIAGTNADRFAQVLGLAIVELWSELPRELQQTLFERAVLLGHQTERDPITNAQRRPEPQSRDKRPRAAI